MLWRRGGRDEVPKVCRQQHVGASSAPEANHSVQRVSKLCAIMEGVASLQSPGSTSVLGCTRAPW